ncbi:hypothetical protein D3C72_1829680 [compost metagenome]
MATSGIGRPARVASFSTVCISHNSVLVLGWVMTWAPTDHLAMVLDISSEMNEPPKPISAANASSMPRLRPLAVR